MSCGTALSRRDRADGHKHRSCDLAVRREQTPGASRSGAGVDMELNDIILLISFAITMRSGYW